jgi:hypothetical protein
MGVPLNGWCIDGIVFMMENPIEMDDLALQINPHCRKPPAQCDPMQSMKR